jgi:primosomal protein N' (replication factor Y) (superfamily II helicase)
MFSRRAVGLFNPRALVARPYGAPIHDSDTCFPIHEYPKLPFERSEVINRTMSRQAGRFARIIIPSPLKEPLTYRIPEELKDLVAVGMRVLIPLGKRKVSGIVFELVSETPLQHTKDVLAALDEAPIVDRLLLNLSQWASQYYVASLGEVLSTILPPSSRMEVESIVFAKCGSMQPDDLLGQKILDVLRNKKGRTSLKSLTRAFGKTDISNALKQLQSVEAVEIRERLPGQRRRRRIDRFQPCASPSADSKRFTLSTQQSAALAAIEARLKSGGFATFLLHGVTGSGKTEVYLRAMECVRSNGRQSLILIPEISLTPQLLNRVNARFNGRVGVLHSGLTAAERWAQWWQIKRGEVDIVVGARSAVFAPLHNIGLIIADEEHDGSYKQDDGLRYNARDVAVMRGKLSACPVILGSATPSLESYENCRQGRYQLLEISQRVEQRPLPTIEIYDLRNQFKAVSETSTNAAGTESRKQKSAGERLLSDPLANALRQNFEDNRQTLIFLNRRGFANFLQCTRCGYVLRCSYCSVTLTLHSKRNLVRCHHCDFSRPAGELCPDCNNETLAGVGAGTEQIEKTLQELIPEARIARMDRDTTSKRGSHADLMRRWERGDFDILIGTQMITKGHDVSGVTLVGALLADMSLNLPDFRSAERTFQLLSQVAGRSGRGNDPGRVIVQTYGPEHYAIEPLITHDYKKFFAKEIEFRRTLGYPPFGKLVNLRLDGPNPKNVELKAQALANKIRAIQSRNPQYREHIEILGPAPSPIEKLRNRYRWQLLLKGNQIGPLIALANVARETFTRARNVRLHVDVDPYNML